VSPFSALPPLTKCQLESPAGQGHFPLLAVARPCRVGNHRTSQQGVDRPKTNRPAPSRARAGFAVSVPVASVSRSVSPTEQTQLRNGMKMRRFTANSQVSASPTFLLMKDVGDDRAHMSG
jgi:hypothetical protein